MKKSMLRSMLSRPTNAIPKMRPSIAAIEELFRYLNAIAMYGTASGVIVAPTRIAPA